MEMNEYQKRAMTTCMPSCNNWSYMMLNLVGEVGELASKVAKAIRKNEVTIDNEMLLPKNFAYPDHFLEDLRAEAGDILWQLSGLCEVLGFPLDLARFAVSNGAVIHLRYDEDHWRLIWE